VITTVEVGTYDQANNDKDSNQDQHFACHQRKLY
jgi:hypothetical protein